MTLGFYRASFEFRFDLCEVRLEDDYHHTVLGGCAKDHSISDGCHLADDPLGDHRGVEYGDPHNVKETIHVTTSQN